MSTAVPAPVGDGLPEAVTIGVSIHVPEPYGSAIQDARAGHGDPLARSIPTHVTLLPPTGIPLDRLAEVETHLRAVAAGHAPFPMLLQGSGTFRPVSPVVFVRVEEGAQECRALEAAVRSGPLARELAFPFHPHVTVAHGLPEEVLDRAYAEARTFHAAFPVPGFVLSRFGEDEVWRPLRSYAFGAG
ncbi:MULTISPECIES: 2'-5' RNA ligase family protein [unclassified Kitasatospora]|uniref:2'-5' RNA ligase family protein n=1 Tax=unclassified Kitasatospora TaxID=2633591 RepID=UPI00070FDFBB|nr:MULTISPECIES: 2'-5' RNA ligase family protein [unclassified Kitasatospora]KQV18393.1 2'-5' RNA ligase [Kitasatospora sp. Root107]KRB74380.1 2'-5' RNA ligase [Kitasatospora sp. Root187]